MSERVVDGVFDHQEGCRAPDYGPCTCQQYPCECPARKALERLIEATYQSAVANGEESMAVRMARIHATAALAAPCPCDQLRAELDHRETEYRILSDADEELEAERDQLRADHAALCDQSDSYRQTTEKLLGREIPVSEGRLEGWLCSMREIHDLQAENAALRQQVAAHQEWLARDSQHAENQRLRADRDQLHAENAELRRQSREVATEVMRVHAILREVLEAVLGRRL